jgi:hypothetical protein
MNAQQFAKKTAIAFAKDEHALRARDCLEPPDAGALQGLTERDGFKQSIRASDAIEAHRNFSPSRKIARINIASAVMRIA